MVTIPRAGVSSAQLSTDTPSLQRPSAFGDRSLEIIGDALVKVNAKFREVENLNQKVEAISAVNKKVFEIDKQAEDHKDPFTLEETYGPMYDQAVEDASEMISDPKTRAQFRMEANNKSILSQRALRAMARNRQASHYKGNVVTKNEEDIQIYFAETDAAKRFELKEGMFARIEEAKNAGAYSEEEAAILNKNLKDTMRLGQARYDALQDPASALEKIRSEKNPYGLNEIEKKELETETLALWDKQKKQQELEVALNTGKMDQEIGYRLIADDITLDELEDLYILTQMGQDGGISAEMYQIGVNAIKSGNSVDSLEDGAAWLELNEQFMEINRLHEKKKLTKKENFAKLAEFRANLMKATMVDGIVGKDKAQKWFQMIDPYYDKQLDEQARRNFGARNGWFENTINGINIFVDEFAGEDKKEDLKARLGDEIMYRILYENDGTRPPQEIINEITEREHNKINPKRILYPLKKEVPVAPGVKGIVIGYRLEDGEPIIYYEE